MVAVVIIRIIIIIIMQHFYRAISLTSQVIQIHTHINKNYNVKSITKKLEYVHMISDEKSKKNLSCKTYVSNISLGLTFSFVTLTLNKSIFLIFENMNNTLYFIPCLSAFCRCIIVCRRYNIIITFATRSAIHGEYI